MTGLERNADVVEMATYAPLFAHVEGWQWRPDLIWFDNNDCVRTSSYYVQQLYCQNRGDRVLPLSMDGKPVAGLEGQNGLFASAVSDGDDIVVKIANTGEVSQPFTLNISGVKESKPLRYLTSTRLSAADDAENTIERPDVVVPVTTTSSVEVSDMWSTVVPARSFTVYRFSH